MPAIVTSGSTTANIVGTITSTPIFPVLGASQTAVKAGTTYSGQSIGTSGATIYTPTGGKTFYLTSFTYAAYSAGINWHLSDGASTPFVAGGNLTSTTTVITFPEPIKITTDLRLFNNGTQTCGWSLTGFEL